MAFFRRAIELTARGHDDAGATTRRLRFRRIMRKLQANGFAELDKNQFSDRIAVARAIKDRLSAINFAEFDDDYEYGGSETTPGCFYDGMNMKFDGKGETNEIVEDVGFELRWQEEEYSVEEDADEGFGDGPESFGHEENQDKERWEDEEDEEGDYLSDD